MKKFLSVVLILSMTVFILTPRVQANPIAIAAGTVEVGALAFWGGAALVASAGAIVGMDPSTSQAIREFGESAWKNANDAIKAGISASVGFMASEWDTAKRFAVEFPQDVAAYLKQEWTNFFGKGYAVDESGKVIKVATMLGTFLPSEVWASPQYTGTTRNNIGYLNGWEIKNVYVTSQGVATVVFYKGTLAGYSDFIDKANNKAFPNAMAAYGYAVSTFGITKGANTIDPTFDDYGGKPYRIPTFPDVFPQKLNLPAVGGVLNPDGTIASYKTPTIGRLGEVPGADVAIGYPAVPGDIGALKETDVISNNPAVPGTGTWEQDISGIRTDVGTMTRTLEGIRTDINNPARPDAPTWGGKLKALVTTKFPFSLPWDFMAVLGVINADPVRPEISVNEKYMGFNIKFEHRFEYLDAYMPFFRGFIVVAFCLQLVMVTRKLLGGAT